MSTQGPVLVRIDEASAAVPPSLQAGFSERIARRVWEGVDEPTPSGRFKWLRIALLVLGIGGLGYYGFTLADQHVYQAYENWAFEQQIAGHPAVNFSDYLGAKTSLSRWDKPAAPSPAIVARTPQSAQPVASVRPAMGSLLGRLEIPRLSLSAIVREGSDAATLSRAVGHVPSTALAGRSGNFAIAAHRDTLFRGLKDIKDGDLVQFQTASATYRYQVFSTRVVKPSEVSVLRADAGLPQRDLGVGPDSEPPPQLLTMITCYPFSYIGSAPERFIVTARQIADRMQPAAQQVQAGVIKAPQQTPVIVPVHRRPRIQSRSFSNTRSSSRPATRVAVQIRSTPAPKHRPFWRKLLHSN